MLLERIPIKKIDRAIEEPDNIIINSSNSFNTKKSTMKFIILIFTLDCYLQTVFYAYRTVVRFRSRQIV